MMYTHKIPEDLNCGIVVAMKVIGAKWKPCILDTIRRGYHRPSEMHLHIAEAAPRVIDMQLRQLEKHGIIKKQINGRFPLHTNYFLTELGASNLPIIDELDAWGSKNKLLFADKDDELHPVPESTFSNASNNRHNP